MIVRHVAKSELAETASLLRAAFSVALPPGHEPYLDDLTNVEARMRDAELFVAVVDDRVVGTGALYAPQVNALSYPAHVPRRPWPPTWAVLRSLAVDPAHRRKGIARTLIEERIARARALGARAVALHCGLDRDTVAGLFTPRGWERAPRYDFFPLRDVRAEAYVLTLR